MRAVVTRSMESLWDIEERTLPAVERGNVLAPVPLIERQGIRWTGGVRGEPLRIELTFENPAGSPSVESVAGVEVAAFGAFVPWKPLTRLLVPAIPPGGRRVVTATASVDVSPPRPTLSYIMRLKRLQACWEDAAWPFGLLPRRRWRSTPTDRKPGESALKSFPCPHFVGNLNVFVNREKPAERHVRHAVGLAPGRGNWALFRVGDGRQDTYTFRVSRIEPGWDACLLGYDWDVPVEITSANVPLAILPAERAESGGLAIAVQRESNRKEALVEFEIETTASGSKCYFF